MSKIGKMMLGDGREQENNNEGRTVKERERETAMEGRARVEGRKARSKENWIEHDRSVWKSEKDMNNRKRKQKGRRER